MSQIAYSTLSLNKFAALLLLPLLLTACGFEPLYGKHKNADILFAGVDIDPIEGRDGQQFRIALEDELNPGGAMPAKPAYRLSATLKNSESAIDVARDGTVSRYNVYLDSKYTLTRLSDNSVMTAGNLRHVSSYNNITNQYFSTYVSQGDALKRGLAEMSKLYRQRLAAYLTQNDGRPPVQDKNFVPAKKSLPVPVNPADQNGGSPVFGIDKR